MAATKIYITGKGCGGGKGVSIFNGSSYFLEGRTWSARVAAPKKRERKREGDADEKKGGKFRSKFFNWYANGFFLFLRVTLELSEI